MKKIRILSGLLALLMLVGSFAACGETTEDPVQSNAATTAPTVTEAETELTDRLPDDLNYGDTDITIINRYREGWTSGEIAVEEIISEPVNDAVYERNRFVEQRLGVEIVSIEENNYDPFHVVNKVAQAVRSGTDDYDMMAAACYVSVNESLSGTFADLRKTEYLDFDMPWWSQGFNEVVEYHGAQYAVSGDMVLSLYRFAFVTIFNKFLFTESNQPYLYDYVENGSWTLDKQIQLVPLFERDNGNAKQDTEGDIYGLISNDYISVDPYWSSCMVDIIKKNGDGDYEFVFDSAKLFDVCEKTMKLFYGCGNATYNVKHYGADSEQNDIRDMFADGYSAMATVRILELEAGSIRNMEQEFGVVPMPKFDENQKDYRTLLHDQFTVLCVPTTVKGDDLDMVSAVMEALASASYRTVRPAYYETTLRTKIAQDPQSAEMFDLIIDNIYIDAGIIYTNALYTFHDKFRQIMGSGKNTVTSQYKSVARSAGKSLERMVMQLEKIPARG
jgi:ABC-type glycerol-3-phosphate transport system substrate-binding protein